MTTTFDHRGGNEWWVEVRVTGGDTHVVHAIESDGNSMELRPNDWGNHVGSMHIEPGNTIRFAANARDGTPARESCWFTHPAGVEQCETAPPPPPSAGQWTHGAIGSVPEGIHDMAIGDADRDGTPELYALGYFAGIYRFTQITADSADRSVVVSGCCWGHLAVGDGDRDGMSEVYATGPGGLHQFKWTGSAWSDRIISADLNGPLTLGDLDHDGLREIYVAGYSQGSSGIWNETVTQVMFTGGAWHTQTVAQMTVDPQYPVKPSRVWIGDADRDGLTDLVMIAGGKPGPRILMASHTAAGWSMSHVTGREANTGIVAGDVDHDGLGEVASTSGPSKQVFTYTKETSGWTTTQVATLPAWIADLFLADGDNDGTQEIYVAAGNGGNPPTDGHAYQVRKGATWTVTDMGAASVPVSSTDRIIAGDADGSGRQSVYMATFNSQATSRLGNIERYTWTPGIFDATFTGVRGNEWWVQADVKAAGGTLSKVDVRLDGGAWKPLTKQSWGANAYAASYHITAGTVVQLRATSTTGATDLSDCYKWIPPTNTDAAKTACTGTPPPPPPAGFDATFTGVRGNEWWEQANVAATGDTLSKVDVRLNGAEWKPLVKQSWGGWAASYHAVQGTVVQFRATSATGATDLSDCYAWIPPANTDAAKTACTGTPPPPPPSDFDATFTGVKGNDWWVQANVAANQALAGVDARVDCAATWKPLAKQSWGGWAASFHIPSGSKVDFRATSTGGATDLSGGYTWPEATAAPAC